MDDDEDLSLLNEYLKISGDAKEAEIVINSLSKESINRRNAKGFFPLFYAVYANNLEVTSLLLRKGADINVKDDTGFTVLHIACKEGYLEITELLLRNGALVNGPDANLLKSAAYLTTPLNLALQNNRVEIVKILLKNGADPNIPHFLAPEIHRFPLKFTECLQLLLEYGADPNTCNRSGQPLIIKACLENCMDAVEILINRPEVNVNAVESISNFTALHCAIICGNTKLVEKLLETGAKIQSNLSDVTALDLAITRTKLDIVDILLQKNLDLNAFNAEGCGSLSAVAQPSYTHLQFRRLIKTLLSMGADPRISGKKYKYFLPSFTPLLEYLTYQNEYDLQVIHTLVQYGASVKISLPTRYLKPKTVDGLLNQLHKLENDPDIFCFLLNVADTFETAAIKRSKKMKKEIIDILLREASICRPLRNITLNSIRKILKCPLTESVKELVLPELLKKMIIYEPLTNYI
ncbi:DgyrCDS4554 [Dimorphilus gyrociliatus]|uniref:DgyrCDS4554 n=1 Tax=Dimorphilus gyrociliatus TaxID=2664684 RepID=A0A7I8VJJ3_9ANNE|nr:DgyrCDS4554 [Dimorphilus gyrociliatus]